uniref:tRNA-yW synthesizing protein 1 homolog (S. cerevisiae) n=1 Tax=Oncorhynchus mykiss TaxID=8022 RepID=A0A8C7TEV0_ONCMY
FAGTKKTVRSAFKSIFLSVWQNRIYLHTAADVLVGIWFSLKMALKKCSNKLVCMFLLAVYTDGHPTENAEWFCKCLEEASTDFRYGNAYLKGLRYAVFGLGNSVYGCHYNTVSKNVDKWLWMLSGIRVLSRGDGNCNVANSHNGSVHADFLVWKTKFLSCLQALVAGQKKACSGNCNMGSSCKTRNRKKPQSSEELVESSSDEETTGSEENSPGSVIDVEDLGNILNGIKKAKKREQSQEDGQIVKLSWLNGMMKAEEKEERRESGCDMTILYMFSSTGYKVIGSHSGGKRCRWTKSMLRGRGGCYKPSFYGVESHRCMESTLSLVCANKHHTNPVGTEWRWKMDLVEERGGANQNVSRLLCPTLISLSLTVISLSLSPCSHSLPVSPFPPLSRSHPRILFLSDLFPSKSLVPVTKLYVSVGAGTKGSLKKIDQLLFNDFWPRFLDSLKALGEKRTVYKLTLVKTWTVDKLKAYSEHKTKDISGC